MKLAEGGRPNGLAMWLGHYQIYFMVVTVPVYITTVLLGSPLVPVAILCVLGAAWLLAAVAHMRVHRNNLCERCISGAPLIDPQGAVDRWHLALRVDHMPRAVLTLTFSALAAMFAVDLAHLPFYFSEIAVAVLVLNFGGYAYAGYQHQRLQTWCPYCPHDGGDGEEAPKLVPGTPLTLR